MSEQISLGIELLDNGSMIAGRYQIQRLLGSGGMGTIYLANDLGQDGKQIAIKILHREFSRNKRYVQRFIREAELMETVFHPNVVQVFDFCTDEGLIYFTMEYVPGQSLEHIMESGTLLSSFIPSLICQICEGLKAIHEANFIHRDLKPGNILVTEDNIVKITDFGVARPTSSNLTGINEKVGSVFYMAPEIWEGKPLTRAVDFYSLGVLLYEAVTGHLPFEHEKPLELMRMHLKKSVTKPKEYNANVEPWLEKLILWLLEKSPEKRPKSPEDIIEFVNSRGHNISSPSLRQVPTTSPSGTQPSILPSSSSNSRISKSKLSATVVLSLTATPSKYDTSQSGQKRPKRKTTIMFKLPRRAALVFEIEVPSRDFLFLGIFFISLQILDAYLTSVGISRFGLKAEGNPVLRNLMHQLGPHQTLALVKVLAVGTVAYLTFLAKRLKWVKDLIAVLSCIYLCAAIIPWTYILFYQYGKH